MGYYTRHELEVVQGDNNETDYEAEISELADYGNCFDDECKWYEHENDMRAYSLKHPQTVFALKGEGEESGDIWTEYYKNGKMQKCKAKIVVDDYNENLLD